MWEHATTTCMAAELKAVITLHRSLQTLTAWVAATAAGIDGRNPADMVLLFAALQAAAKQVAFAVSQVRRSAARPGLYCCDTLIGLHLDCQNS